MDSNDGVVRQVRPVKDNLQLAFVIDRVGKRVLDLDLVPAFMRCEVVITHRNAHVPDDLGTDVLPSNCRPWLDCKAMILRVIAIASNEALSRSFNV